MLPLRRRLCFVSLVLIAFAAFCPAQTEEEIDHWYERADKFASRGQWRRAAKYYGKIFAVEPGDEELGDAFFLSLLGCGRYPDALKIASQFHQKDPSQRSWLLRYHRVLRAMGRDRNALELLDGFLASGHADDMEMLSLKGRLLLEHGRDREAKQIFDALIERAKKEVIRSSRDLTALGRAFQFYRHGGDAAEEALASAQKADPRNLEAFYELARVYGKLKVRPTDMERELKDALELRPQWPRFLVGLIRACDLRLGQAEREKRALIVKVLRINPRHPEALYHQGMRRLSDAQWKRAEESFKKALATNPHHIPALSGLAALRFVTGEMAAWKELEKRVLALDPTCADLYRVVAEGLSERRRWDESQTFMKKAVALDPEDPDLWDLLARYSLYIGREQEGMEALRKAYDLATWNRVWRGNMMDVMKLLAKHYETVKSPHFVVKLHREDAPLLRNIVPPFFERSWSEFVERYGFKPRVPVIVDAFRRHQDFSVRTMGTTGLGALGVCFGPTVMMYIPRKTRRPINWASTAHHELAHVFTLQASRGRVPRWLTEGLSTWEEVRRNPSWGRNMEIQLHDALHNDKLLKVLEFDSAFYGPRIIFAYFQGGITCQFIEKRWGLKAIREMLSAYGRGQLTSEVIPQVLQLSPQEFDRAFRGFVQEMLQPLKRMPRYDDDTIRRAELALKKGEDKLENALKCAWGHFKAGRDLDAVAFLKILLDGGFQDDRIVLLQAHRAWRGGRKGRARELYQQLLDRGVENYEMTRRMAAWLESQGDDAGSLALWKKARNQNPWSIDPRRSPYMVLARRWKSMGKLEAWAGEMERFCALVDTAVEQRLELVEYYASLRKWSDAVRLLRECLDVKTFDGKLRFKLAEILLHQQQTQASLKELEAVLLLKPESDLEFKVRLTLGRLLLKLDRADDASYHLARAVELRPDHGEARRLLEKSEEDEE